MAHLITEQGDIVTLPVPVLWGGINNNLGGIARKIQVGSLPPYIYPSALVASLAYEKLKGALVNWDGSKAIDQTPPQIQSQVTVTSIVAATFVQGDTVQIIGTNFDTSTLVYFGDTRAETQLIDAQIFSAVVPAITTGTIVVTVMNGDYRNMATINGNVGSITFASITPGTAASGVSVSFVVTGTGFNSDVSSVEDMRFDDGNGHIAYCGESLVSSDTSENVGFVLFPVAGTYTLYYSTDNGATWTTTGLTVTVS
jgi:IPT/TIG domain